MKNDFNHRVETLSSNNIKLQGAFRNCCQIIWGWVVNVTAQIREVPAIPTPAFPTTDAQKHLPAGFMPMVSLGKYWTDFRYFWCSIVVRVHLGWNQFVEWNRSSASRTANNWMLCQVDSTGRTIHPAENAVWAGSTHIGPVLRCCVLCYAFTLMLHVTADNVVWTCERYCAHICNYYDYSNYDYYYCYCYYLLLQIGWPAYQA